MSSCVNTIHKAISEIEELSILQQEIDTLFSSNLYIEEDKLRKRVNYIKVEDKNMPEIIKVNIPFMSLHQISEERLDIESDIQAIKDKIEKEKKKGIKKNPLSPTEFTFRKAKNHTVNSTIKKRMRNNVQTIDFLPPHSSSSNSTSGSSSLLSISSSSPSSSSTTSFSSSSISPSSSSSLNSSITHSSNSHLVGNHQSSNNHINGGISGNNLENEKRKRTKKKFIDIVDDLESLHHLKDDDFEKIIACFSPMIKKNITRSIKESANENGSNEFYDASKIESIPSIPICKLKGGNAMSTIKGPGHSSVDIPIFGDHFACKSMSTYPQREGFHVRDGDPVCDRFFVKLFENRIVTALSDGHCWGERSRKAAKKACKAVVMLLSQKQKEMQSVKDVASVIMDGFSDAHRRILEGVTEAVWESGCSTLLSCNLIELDDTNEFPLYMKNGKRAKWAVVGGNVGDCKAFLYSNSEKKAYDLTKITRLKLFESIDDPGGKLGNGKPDLRNYNLFFRGCEEDDVILLVTDGVYDNYNPPLIGLDPSFFGRNSNKWEDLDFEVANKIINNYMCKEFARIISSRGLLPDICNKIMEECYSLTEKRRNYWTDHPADRIPTDTKAYPGSIGHATVLAFRVGEITLSYNKWMGINK